MVDSDSCPLEALICGYAYRPQQSMQEPAAYECQSCGAVFEEGEIFDIGGRLFDARRAVQLHLTLEHPNRLHELLNTQNKYLMLTDNQKELLDFISEGLTDNQIAAQLSVSASTVRHQRFMFREKAKAAKMYLAVWEMAASASEKKKQAIKQDLLPIHGGAKMVDERYCITEEENDKIIASAFESMEPLKLKALSPKEKKKIVILRRIAHQFEQGRRYTEKEVNHILEDIYEDYVTLRRYLIEYGYMGRTKDCKEYWLR